MTIFWGVRVRIKNPGHAQHCRPFSRLFAFHFISVQREDVFSKIVQDSSFNQRIHLILSQRQSITNFIPFYSDQIEIVLVPLYLNTNMIVNAKGILKPQTSVIKNARNSSQLSPHYTKDYES